MIEKVICILRECMEKVTEDMELVADLGLGSLDMMNAVLTFEEEFEVEISDEKIQEFRTVGDIVRYLEEERPCFPYGD